MKHVKVYIVTYKNEEHLNENLRTLFGSWDLSENITMEVYVINNHTDFKMDENYYDRGVKVLHNQTRPDFSVGHLPRDWNAALVQGFVDLNNPECDVVLLSQDDTIWAPQSLQRIVDQTLFYDFIALGNGDCVCAFTPNGVRTVGLFDESRFSSNGFHEMDYFLRAALYLGHKASINDIWHQLLPQVRNNFGPNPYLWNQLPYGPRELIYRPDSNEERKGDKDKYSVYHSIAREAFKEKWGVYPELKPLAQQVIDHANGPLQKQTILYPYFEKDLNHDTTNTNYVEHYRWW